MKRAVGGWKKGIHNPQPAGNPSRRPTNSEGQGDDTSAIGGRGALRSSTTIARRSSKPHNPGQQPLEVRNERTVSELGNTAEWPKGRASVHYTRKPNPDEWIGGASET